MNRKNNQRYINTEEKINNALNILLKQKQLKKITVRDICREAQIHHTTFYEHYADIFDLIEKTELQMGQRLVEHIKIEKGIENNIISISFITAIMEYVKENRDFYTAYLNDYGASSIDKEFEIVWSEIEETISDNEPCNYNKLKYSFEFSKAGVLKVISCWLNSGCHESVNEISQILFRLLRLLLMQKVVVTSMEEEAIFEDLPAGILSKYANQEKQLLEEGAFERAMVEKHGDDGYKSYNT